MDFELAEANPNRIAYIMPCCTVCFSSPCRLGTTDWELWRPKPLSSSHLTQVRRCDCLANHGLSKKVAFDEGKKLLFADPRSLAVLAFPVTWQGQIGVEQRQLNQAPTSAKYIGALVTKMTDVWFVDEASRISRGSGRSSVKNRCVTGKEIAERKLELDGLQECQRTLWER